MICDFEFKKKKQFYSLCCYKSECQNYERYYSNTEVNRRRRFHQLRLNDTENKVA